MSSSEFYQIQKIEGTISLISHDHMNFAVSDRGKALEAVALTEVVKLVATVIRFSISNFIFKQFVVVDGCTENELPWELRNNTRKIRLSQFLTQKELAKKYGCSRQNLSKFEQGDFTSVLTSLKSLRKIATLLNVTLLDLMKGVVFTKSD